MDYFLARVARRLGQAPRQLSATALQLLLDYSWPGNVRELENIATRASVLSGSETVSVGELRPWLIDQRPPSGGGSDVPVGVSLYEMERRLIEATLDHFHGHRGKTAQALGIGVRTLANKLRSYGYGPRERPIRKSA
jgi:DNA-binding NtrC family response regulator